ncbi:Hypothetical protein CINCED_3A017569 [Cinara cedri]|uniref:Uncharacterized protein n=1 Tax=Cinara cedri TaxID=506608 RepID=A0A5E4N0M4_9HEMI|nr:Hypothetical protein CINCED_3A017569 [Cinara cedri]
MRMRKEEADERVLCDGNGGRRLNRSLTSGRGGDDGGYTYENARNGTATDSRRRAAAVPRRGHRSSAAVALRTRPASPTETDDRRRAEGRRDAAPVYHARVIAIPLFNRNTISRAQRAVASSFHFATRRPQQQPQQQQQQRQRRFPRASRAAGRIT